MKNIFLTALLIMTAIGGLVAQQDAQYTQYMYNTLSVNPAYAGSRDVFSIAALHRSQWIGLDGAPTTQTLNLHTPVSNNVGIGLSIVNDEIGNGTNQDTYFDAAFSYTVNTSENNKLSFGLKAGGHFLNIDFNQLRNYTAEGTASAATNIDNKFSPNFGAGVYYHTNKFYAGLSVPNFLKTEHFDTSGSTSLAEERVNIYLITGYVFELNPIWKLKPAALVKAVNGAPLQLDLSANFILKDQFYFGAAYRLGAAASALIGMQVSDSFMVGLAYDKETTALGNTAFNNGSFEVFLRYEFKKKLEEDIPSPRYF